MNDSPVLSTFHESFGVSLTVAVLLMSLTGAASAEGPPRLPPEAYAACDSKREGDACSIVIRDMQIAGTCTTGDGTDRLFCRPSGPPPPRVTSEPPPPR